MLAGGYVLRRAAGAPALTLVGVGVVLPEVLRAADRLAQAEVPVDVVCLTSADLVFRALQSRRGLSLADTGVLHSLFPAARAAPMITVLDGHPHTLSFLAGIHGVRITCLGVDDFGQVGDVPDLYKHFGIDPDTIVGAAWDLLEEAEARTPAEPV